MRGQLNDVLHLGWPFLKRGLLCGCAYNKSPSSLRSIFGHIICGHSQIGEQYSPKTGHSTSVKRSL